MVSQLMIPFMAIIVVIAVVVVAIISSRGGKDYLITTTTTTTRCRGYYYCHGSDDWPCQSTSHIYYVWHRRALPSPQSRHRLAALLHGCFYCYYYTATILFLAISLVLLVFEEQICGHFLGCSFMGCTVCVGANWREEDNGWAFVALFSPICLDDDN
jgi:hypothetical protein